MKKLLKKLSVMRLEERVLFDAAAAAAAAEAENQAQQNEELQQQQQQLQEQLAEEAAKQQAQQQAPGTESELPGENDTQESEAAAPQEGEGKAFEAAAASEVAAAVEAIAADEDIEVEEKSDVLETASQETAGENVADVVVLDTEADAEEEILAQTPAEIAAAIAEGSRHELVIVSESVKDSKSIIDGLAEGTEVLVLDSKSDVLDQINEYLDSTSVKYDAIHVISHGGDGYLLLNNSVIDMQSLEADPASWAAIGEHVAENGDILLYGCNVAQSENGKAFANQLASLTGADIAASIDNVGGSYGWELEYVTNAVATPVLSMNGYSDLLASLNLTVVEQGAAGEYEGKWVTSKEPSVAAGDYYWISDGTAADEKGNRIAEGQLTKITVADGEGGAKTYKYEAQANKGSFEWAIQQSYTNIGDDIITIAKENVVGDNAALNLSAFNNRLAYDVRITDAAGEQGYRGGLTISANGIDLTFSGSNNNIWVFGDVSITAKAVVFNQGIYVGTLFDSPGTTDFTINANTITVNGDFENSTGKVDFDTDSITNPDDPSGSPLYGNIQINGSAVLDTEATFTAQGNITITGDVDVIGTDVSFITEDSPLTSYEDEFQFSVGGDFTVTEGHNYVVNLSTGQEWESSMDSTVDIYAARVHFGGDFYVQSHDWATEFTPDWDRHPVVTVNVTGLRGGTEDSPAESLTFAGDVSVISELGGYANVTLESERDVMVSGLRDYIVAPVNGNLTVSKDSQLILNYGVKAENPALQGGQFQLWFKGEDTNNQTTSFVNNGLITGNGSLRITSSDPTNKISGSGQFDMSNGSAVQYDFAISSYEMLEKIVYVGDYDNLTVNFGGNNISLNEAFFKPRTGAQGEALGRSIGTITVSGSGVVTMSGTYANINTTIDVDWEGTTLHGLANASTPATVTFKYVETGVQYVLGGQYYSLEVGSSMNKILSGSIEVGVNPSILKELAEEDPMPEAPAEPPSFSNASEWLDYQDAMEDYARNVLRVPEWYNGTMTLGTTLHTEGFDVTFYGNTLTQPGRDALIYGTSGTVTYVASADHSNSRVFYGGTYGHLAIAAAPGRALSDINLMDDPENLTFVVDEDITLYGGLVVKAQGSAGTGTFMHNFTVNVTGAVKNIAGIEVTDANLHFYGNVNGNLAAISATRSDSYLEKGSDDNVQIPVVEKYNTGLSLTFGYGNINIIGTASFNGYDVEFDPNVNIGALKTLKVVDANVYFDNTFTNLKGNPVEIDTLTATRSRTDEGLNVVFGNAIGGIETITLQGYNVDFIGNAGSVDTINLGTTTIAGINYVNSLNFVDGVTVNTAINIEGGDIGSGRLHTIDFSGETSGNAVVDSYLGRSTISYNYDGDQTVFKGRYHDLVINGTGIKTIEAGTGITDRVFVGGTLYAFDSQINVAAGIFEFSAFDPAMTPTISINSGAQMIFGKASTAIVTFNGDIITAGTLTFQGQIHVTGEVTILDGGTMSVDTSAIGSIFDLVNNKGTLTLENNNITIGELNNYSTLTVTDTRVRLNVYNHATGTIVFDLEATSAGNTFTFNQGQADTYNAAAGNRLINGGTIDVRRGTLNLSNFTQGDRTVADDSSVTWSYDKMNYLVASGASLIFGTANVNNGTPTAGSNSAPGGGAYLGNIVNSGLVQITADDARFNGNVTNNAGSRLETERTSVTFNGDFSHAGVIAIMAGASGSGTPRITFNGNVTGAGTVDYAGAIVYAGGEGKTQRILDGSYSNTVTIKGAGEKTVAGNVVFNGNAELSSVLSGESGSVTFNGATSGVEVEGTETFGEFAGSLDVIYSNAAHKIFSGTYGELTINSTNRTVSDTFTAEVLSFNGNAEITSEITVTDSIVLGNNSATVFNGILSNGGAADNAVISGGTGAEVEFRTNTVSGISVRDLAAVVTYSYDGTETQQILAGTYNNNVTFTGTEKAVDANVTITGTLTSSASAVNVTGNGTVLKVIGNIFVDSINVSAGNTLDLILSDSAQHNRLGTADGAGIVTLGGLLRVTEKVDNNGNLDVYGWADVGDAGRIEVRGGIIEFMGTAAQYGYVNAYVNNDGGTVIDSDTDGSARLQNLWVMIYGDKFTSELTSYSTNSKFMIMDGASLTVDHFTVMIDDDNDSTTPDVLAIKNVVAAFQLIGDAELIFNLDNDYFAAYAHRSITVNSLILDNAGNSKVTVTAGNSVTISSQADLYGEGAVTGSGNFSLKANGIYTGDGTFNMTGGDVIYGSNTRVYGGTYNNLRLNNNTSIEGGTVIVNNEATVFGTLHLTDSAMLRFEGTTQKANTTDKIDAEAGTSVAYAATADVYAGTYGNLGIDGDHTILGNIVVNGTAAFTGTQTGSGNWTFNGINSVTTGSVENDGTVTYNGSTLFAGSYNNLILSGGNSVAGTVTAETVTLSGALNAAADANVTFNGTTDAQASGNDGYIQAEAGSRFTYGANANVYSGTYGDLTVNGEHKLLSSYVAALGANQGITINGAATFEGIISGNARVTFNGETYGNATFGDIATNKTYTGLVTYGENSGAIYGGQYNNITIIGDHSVNDDLTINLIAGGTFKLNSTLTLGENVELTINGLTDAAEEGNKGSINGAASSVVTYGYNASIYAGTYGTLNAEGTEYSLNGDITVNTAANLKGTFLGGSNVTFNGATSGNAVFGVIGDETKVFGGTVTYNANALNVYGGNYANLVIAGNRTLAASFAVVNSANISGVMSGTAAVTFGQGAALTGGVTFGADGADYQGTVTYNGVENVYGGFYTGLNFANGNTVSAALAASGALQLAGTLNVAAGAQVAFNGTTDANVMSPRNTGVILGAANSKVTYGTKADIYSGSYNDLTVNGSHTLLVNGAYADGIVVNGAAVFNGGVITGNTKVTFNGTTAGNSVFGDIANSKTYTGTVTYSATAELLYGGLYNSIVIGGDENITHTVNNDLQINVIEGGMLKLSSVLSLGEDVTLTLNGLTDAAEEGNTGSIQGADSSHVFYGQNASIYGGTYGKLTAHGTEYTLTKDVVVNNTADLEGIFLGNVDVTFNGATAGNALFGVIGEDSKIFGGAVTYSTNASIVYGGNYYDLVIDGNSTVNANLTVNNSAAIAGTLSGAADVTFVQGAQLSGSGTFGGDEASRYLGTVTYNGVSNVFGGFYSTVAFDNGNTTSAAVNAADVKLSDLLTVTGSGSVIFAGTTDAAASDNDGAIEAEAGTSVVYSSTADVYGGTYGDLTIAGAHNLFSDITVNGNAVITGEQTLVAAVSVTFAGTTNAAENTSGTFKEDGLISNVTYGADAAVFGGTYGNLNITGAHTLSNTFEVTGAAAFTGKQTLGSNVTVTFTGTTNANEQNAEFDGTAGSVIYEGAPGQGVYGGTYGDLTITGDPASNYERILNNHFTVNGVFASGAVLTGNANVTFLGTTTDDGTAFGTESSAYAGNVTYGENAAVYGGFYNTLTIAGDHTLTNDFAVNTTADISGVMSGSARILFAENAQLAGNGTFGSGESSRYNGEVFYYGVNDIYGGFYSSLTLANGNTVSVDVNALNVNLASTLTVSGGASVVFAGTTSASTADISDIIIASAGTSVTYGADADIYGGSYSDLTVNGAHTHYFDIAVSGTAAFTGVQTLSNAVTLIFSGLTNADAAGAGVITADTGDIMVSNVVYLDGAAVFGGSYENLQITGNHTLNNDFTVSNEAAIEGIMLGNAAVAFSGVNTGSGTFGSGEASRYNGVVTYNGNAIYGGYYSGAKNAAGLIITDGTINAGVNVDAASVELTGVLTVNGSIIFSGYTDAVAKGDAAEVYSNGSVAYADTADIYGGTYGNLIIRGDHHFAASLTVSGTTTVLDNADGSDASLTGADGVALVFTGGVTGNGAYFGDGTNAFAGSVTYNGNGEVLGGIYSDLTVNANNEVMGSMTVTGMFTLNDGVRLAGRGDWTIGENNASENSTATIANIGSVTYNGLRSGEAGWIFGGSYADLIVNGGDYSVGLVTITNSFSGSGKYIFTAAVNGVGGADNANADYLYANTLLWGVYNNLGIGAAVDVGETVADIDVTVNGALTALNSSAVISGYGTLLISGTMSGFDSLGRFAHSGNVIFSGSAEYNVDGGSKGSSFGTVTVGEAAELNLTNTAFTNMIGGGDVTFNGNVNGNAVDMRSGTVTYAADAVTELIQGNYYNLVLAQGNDPVIEVAYGKSVVVSGLLDVNGNDILNSGNLTIYRFTNTADTELLNIGNLTFGSNDGAVGAPALRQVWEGEIFNGYVDGRNVYDGQLTVNRANYEFATVVNVGTVTVASSAVAASTAEAVEIGVYSYEDSVFNLASDVVLYDYDDNSQFTNRGTVNISGSWGEYSDLLIYNLSQSNVNVSNTGYVADGAGFTIGNNVRLSNGGTVTFGSNSQVIVAEIAEDVAGRPVYVVNGGRVDFVFKADAVNVRNGLLGEIKNSGGQLYFLTDGGKFYGNITNNSNGELYVWADTTFIGGINSTHGLIQVGNESNLSVDALFSDYVLTGSYFEIMGNAHASFGGIVSVAHEFYMEKGSSALFMNEVRISSTTSNEIDTVFHVKEGAQATFQGDVFNQNGYGFHERDGWANGVSYVTTPTDTRPTDSVIGSKNHASDSSYLSKFIIDGNVVINGKLSNIGYGWNSSANQANIVINSSGNVFGAIDNRGSAARIDMNGDNNQLNGTLVNTGHLYLNGTNDYNDIVNSTTLASWSWKLDGKSQSSPSTAANIFVNDGAAGSTFRKVSLSNNSTFTVISYSNSGIELNFNGEVSNGASAAVINPAYFIINASGSVFNGEVKNYGNFLIHGEAQFNSLFTNYATYQEDITVEGGKRYVGASLTISAEGTRFNRIDNSGVVSVDAFTYFEGVLTNSSTGTVNIDVDNLEFSNIDNDGHINLHGAKQIVIRNLNIGQSSVIDVDKDSSLHLQVVTEDYSGNYANENYDYANDSKLGTIIVRGDQRDGNYEDHTEPNVSDSEHGLFFEDTGVLQTLGSRILYDTTSIEASVWYSANTVLNYEDASWVIVRDGETLTLSAVGTTEKYKVLSGGELIVQEAASGTRIQINNGGSLLFDNDVVAQTITGLVEIRKGGSAVFDSAKSLTFTRNVINAGTFTFNANTVNTFKGGLTNSGTVEAFTAVYGNVSNSGNYIVKGSDVAIDSNLNNSNGTLIVENSADLRADVGGNIQVQEGALLNAAVTEISSALLNNGTVTIDNSSNYLEISGNILKGSGAFNATAPATLVFSGDVATGAAASFSNISNAVYAGTAASQNIILGTYDNLTLNGAVKVVDDGLVTVNGNFANNSEVSITNDGELVLKGSVSGTSAYNNAGLLNFAGTADVAGTVNNSGVLTADGTVNFSDLQNSGAFNANGTVSAAGNNQGTVNVNGTLTAAGFVNSNVVSVAEAGTLVMNDAQMGGVVNNSGNVIANADNTAFGADFRNNGTLTVNGSGATFSGNVNNGTIAVNGVNADFTGARNQGIVALYDTNVNIDALNNDGTVELHAYNGMDLTKMDNRNGVIEFHVDATLTEDITQGRVAVGGGRELTLKMNEVNGSYNANAGTIAFEAVSAAYVSINSDMSVAAQGTLKLNSNAVIYGSFEHNGLVNTQNNDLTFEGTTAGTGRVSGNTSNTVTYGLNAAHIFDGEYANLVIMGASSTGAMSQVTVNDVLQLNNTLAVNGLLTINGATAGNGTMAGGRGEVVYNGSGAEQSIYAGLYNDLTIGANASGNFDIAGNVSIVGNAYNRSVNGAELVIDSGRVTYNGRTSQHVMAGTYDELVMAGAGTKLMEADIFTVRSFSSDGGSHSGMIQLKSASAPAYWTLNADNISIHYTYVDNAAANKEIFLDGTNMTGGGNTNSWLVFNSAGGIGDAYPSINNPNFQAIVPFMNALNLEWGSTARFDAFRRMPAEIQPIVVGDMSELVVLNNFENYDMINFDGEFFGESGISILDEEAGEVLSDAVSAESSDLKALLED